MGRGQRIPSSPARGLRADPADPQDLRHCRDEKQLTDVRHDDGRSALQVLFHRGVVNRHMLKNRGYSAAAEETWLCTRCPPPPCLSHCSGKRTCETFLKQNSVVYFKLPAHAVNAGDSSLETRCAQFLYRSRHLLNCTSSALLPHDATAKRGICCDSFVCLSVTWKDAIIDVTGHDL